jgi:hypothetical protein
MRVLCAKSRGARQWGSDLANVGKHWKRWIAVGCDHGNYACKFAQDSVLAFSERYKPDVRVHLGDLHDFAAFRSGAKGTSDESASVELDFQAGVEWLRRYRPTHRCKGNHDWRIDKLASHPNAIVAHCAGKVLEDLRRIDEKNKTLVRPYHMRDGWWQFGDCKFGHGWMFNEMAVRDHAETFGKCVHAHTHTVGTAIGRTADAPQAWSVGLMGDPNNFEYAHTRRAWLRWAHSLAWGEFSDSYCSVNLVPAVMCNHGGAEMWNFPV